MRKGGRKDRGGTGARKGRRNYAGMEFMHEIQNFYSKLF